FVYVMSEDSIKLLDFSENIFKPKVTVLPNLDKRNTSAKLTKDNDLVVSTALSGIYIFHTDSSFTESDTIIYNYENINKNNGLSVTEHYSLFNFQDKILISTKTARGLYFLEKRNNKYVVFKLKCDNLPIFQMSGFVNNLTEDKNGNIWLQLVSKRYGRKKLYYIAQGKQLKFISKPFSSFPELDYHSIFPEGDSLVWLGTDDGLYQFNWKISKSFSLDKGFSTVINKVSFNDKTVKHIISEQIIENEQNTHSFKKGNIRFDFSAGYYINERKIKYSYILEGYDKKWSAPSFENHKEYTNLPHGLYTFKVKAINPFGAVGNVDEFSFEILTPWYYSFWAIFGGIILLSLLVYAIVKYSNRRLIKAKIRLENIIQSRTAEVHDQKKAIELEKEKADKLLLNILPVRIAAELKATGHCKTEFYESVTVLFTDMCGFTQIAEITDPDELVLKLDAIFTQFDEICSRNKLEKIKTIGDSHMSAGGIPVRNNTHAIDAVLAAMEMQQYIERKVNVDANNVAWKLRIGINTGELTAGVVGKKKFAFDIWGDTVNTASRLQDAGEPSKINISTSTASLVSDFFELKYRGKRPIKHKGEVDMFFVEGIKPELSINNEMIKPNKYFWEKYYELVELKQLDF
ncbi:MAG: hypothetical protein GX259_08095, partial [Bacteroidales bacterium]|nr:hypothetical protein [Bacteroidales bacterium]